MPRLRRGTQATFALLWLSVSPAVFAQLTITTLAGVAGAPGSTDGTGSAARLSSERGLSCDSSGNIWVGDTANSTIRKVTPGGAVTTIAGLATFVGSTDGTGTAARFYSPMGVAVDPTTGNIFVTDYGNYEIRKVTPAGQVVTFAGASGPGNAGTADGTGTAARFEQPDGIVVDTQGNIFVSDSMASTIRKITPAGVVTTWAGTPGVYGGADGTGSAAQFYYPHGMAFDSSGNLYVADSGNGTIRKITPGAVVTTLAGTPGAGSAGSADGTGAAAQFYYPEDVAVDKAGNVWVADTLNSTIRKITPTGVVTTVAGVANAIGSTDGTGTAARFFHPERITIDSSGTIYIADTGNSTIRKAVLAAQIGDANGDGSVSVGDVFYMINNLFAGGPSPVGPADANGDGVVSAADIFYLINYLFAGGPPPK